MSEQRYKKIYIKCPQCDGHKGVYGHSATGHPATLPCPNCNAVGEVELDPKLYVPGFKEDNNEQV